MADGGGVAHGKRTIRVERPSWEKRKEKAWESESEVMCPVPTIWSLKSLVTSQTLIRFSY